MPSVRRRGIALAVVAVLGLAACGGSDAVEEAAVPAPAPEPEPEETEEADEPEHVDDYWSGDRLAALEAGKEGYVPPPPQPTADTTGGGEASTDAAAPTGESATAAAGETPPAQADTYRIEGHVDVPDHVWLREYSDDEPEEGDECRREQKGYRDVSPGTRLTVSDGDGGSLAAGELEAGTVTTSYEDKVGRAMDCRLPFSVEDVPATDAYTIMLEDRGELTFAFDDLERQGWKVAFSIDW